jgi:adenylate kinase
VPNEELLKRLKLRGRPDDAPEAAHERLKIYEERITSILGYLEGKKVPVVHLSGLGTVGEVHDRIVSELKLWQLV